MKRRHYLLQLQNALVSGTVLLVLGFLFLSPAHGQTAGTKVQASGGSTQNDFTTSGQAEVARGDLISAPVTFTQVKQTLTILFGGAKASLGNNMGNVNEPLSATWVGAVRVPANMLGGAKAARLVQQIRGAIAKDEGARIVLTLNLGGETFLGGQTFVVDFPYGKKMNEEVRREFTYSSKTRSFQSYTATIIITIERRDPKALAEIHIDSLDVVNKQDGKSSK